MKTGLTVVSKLIAMLLALGFSLTTMAQVQKKVVLYPQNIFQGVPGNVQERKGHFPSVHNAFKNKGYKICSLAEDGDLKQEVAERLCPGYTHVASIGIAVAPITNSWGESYELTVSMKINGINKKSQKIISNLRDADSSIQEIIEGLLVK